MTRRRSHLHPRKRRRRARLKRCCSCPSPFSPPGNHADLQWSAACCAGQCSTHLVWVAGAGCLHDAAVICWLWYMQHSGPVWASVRWWPQSDSTPLVHRDLLSQLPLQALPAAHRARMQHRRSQAYKVLCLQDLCS